MQRPHGGDRQQPEEAQGKSNNVPLGPAGNTRAKALRRLRKDAPELHAKVLAGSRATVINRSTGFRQICRSRLVTLGYRIGPGAHECQRDDQQDAAMQRPWW
jgi:hypothetical protein